ncbi:zinc ribbon domain-containing protein, partial [Acinetobacter baumannii]|nr:zinc ribbon domain-containing protein [Acinetobacter baumannii]
KSYSTNNNSNEKTKTSISNTNEDIQGDKKLTKEENSENEHLIEKDALIDDQLNEDQVKVAIAFIRLNDYKCDSVSSMAQTRDEKTIRVNCNNYKYKYYINDEGGKWVISLNN